MIGILLVFSIAIVALAGLAGWTNGQREANRARTATSAAAIDEQIRSIPGDIASGNNVLVQARIEWLATQTPAVNGLNDIMLTATAFYNSIQPTATFTPSATFEPSATVDSQEAPIPTPSNGGYDLPALFAQAQADHRHLAVARRY